MSSQVIKTETKKDPVLSKVLNCIMNGLPNHNTEENLKDYFSRRKEHRSRTGVPFMGVKSDCLALLQEKVG